MPKRLPSAMLFWIVAGRKRRPYGRSNCRAAGSGPDFVDDGDTIVEVTVVVITLQAGWRAVQAIR